MRVRLTSFLLASLAFSQSRAPTHQSFLTGNPADAKSKPSAGFALVGGGKDVDAAFEWFVKKAAGGDVVVLRASGADSVESLVIKTPEAANDTTVIGKISNAEALFIAGGDEWNYVHIRRPSPLRAAMQSLIDSGGPKGGTSAGLAVPGQYSFTAEKDTVNSPQALANPYDEHVTIGTDFLYIPLLNKAITDSRFLRRDRMGRLLVFLARNLTDQKPIEARAIAMDERTAVLLEPTGVASIAGEGPAYFPRVSGRPEICRPGTPLTLRHISVYSVKQGGRFDVKTWTGTGGEAYGLSVEAGVIHATQSGGATD
jgi:cyanophycinase